MATDDAITFMLSRLSKENLKLLYQIMDQHALFYQCDKIRAHYRARFGVDP